MGTGTSLNTKRSTATWNHIKHVENIRKWCDVTHCHTCMHVRVCIHTCIHVCVYMYLHTYVYVVVHVWNMKHDTSKARQHDNFILHMYMTTSSSLGTWEDVMGWEVIQTWEDVMGWEVKQTCMKHVAISPHIHRQYKKSIWIKQAREPLDLPETSRANPAQCYSTHQEMHETRWDTPTKQRIHFQ